MSDPTTLLAIRERIEDFCCCFKLPNRGNQELKVRSSSIRIDYESEPQDAMGEVRFATRTTTCKKLLQVSRNFFGMPPLELPAPVQEEEPEKKMTVEEFAADQVKNKMKICDPEVVDLLDADEDSAPSSTQGGGPKTAAQKKKARETGSVRPGGSSETKAKRIRTLKAPYSPPGI